MAGITYRGEKFSGYNKPKRTPGKSKSHAVLIKDGGKDRLIRFGQSGVSGAGKKQMQNLRPDVNLLKPDTQRILLKAKQVQLIGLTRLNGKCLEN